MFILVTAAHIKARSETGARLGILLVAIASTVTMLVTFTFTTLIHEPATIATLVAIVTLSVGLDLGWKCKHARSTTETPS